MKIMKKLAAFVMALSLALPMYSMVGYAANGRVSFTDPKTKTGETVEVTCALRAGGTGLESFDIALEYDTEYLAYESGDEGVTKESDGVLKFSGKGNGEARIGFNIKFVALKEGTTKIEVQEAEGVTAGGESVDCTNGNSTIEIGKGTGEVQLPVSSAEDIPVTVDGKAYKLSDSFKNADIPAGFSEVTLSYEGKERRFIQDANGTATLGYLLNEAGEGEFFLYNPSTNTFSAYVMVTVSPTTTIVLQKADDAVKVPKGYQEVKLTVNDSEFPAWQNLQQDGVYLVYAMNSNTGEKALYQYDTIEESYQKFFGNAAATDEKEDQKETDKIIKLLGDNLMLVLFGMASLIFVFFVLIIVLAVKLRHRNLELDDLYSEDDFYDEEEDYDIILDDKKESKKGFFKKSKKDEEDDFEPINLDDEDDYFYEDENDDYDNDDDIYDDDDDIYDDDDDYYDDDDDYYDDDDYDDDDDFYDDDDDDDYKVDFIGLE